jgi:hypothetical protein
MFPTRKERLKSKKEVDSSKEKSVEKEGDKDIEKDGGKDLEKVEEGEEGIRVEVEKEEEEEEEVEVCQVKEIDVFIIKERDDKHNVSKFPDNI